MTDDFLFDIISDRGLDKALAVAFLEFEKVQSWAEGTTTEGVTKLFFSWSDTPGVFRPWGEGRTPEWQRLPAAMDQETVKPLIIAWLKAHPAERRVDSYADGEGQGWRVRNTDKNGCRYVMFTVEAWLCEYSK